MSQLFYSEKETTDAANKLISKKLFNSAREVLHVGLQCFPDSKHIKVLQAKVAVKMNDFYTAADAYHKLLQDHPDNPEFLINASQTSNHAGDPEKALAYAKRFIKVSKNAQDGLFAMVDIYERNNSPEKAFEILSSLDDKTREGVRWKYIESRLMLSTKRYEDAVDFILKHRDEFENTPETHDKSMASFSLCKAYDRLGEYDKAWQAAVDAHALDETPFNEEKFFGAFDTLDDFMSREIVDALAQGPKTEIEPLLIVGNPRSGTSLLEQIMSMHPDIVNGGEMSVGALMQADIATLTDSYHDFPKNLLDMREADATALSNQYFDAVNIFRTQQKIATNKSLALINQLGFFSKVLPSAKVLMLYRHPLDNAVSCFTTNLIASGHTYTNTLDTLGRTLLARKKLASAWLERLSIPMMELHYESLVVNQREETERLIEFLGLPWNDACMEFHKSKYVARTISYDQVNQKMYTSSTNRWKNYEKHLGELIEMFSDYI